MNDARQRADVKARARIRGFVSGTRDALRTEPKLWLWFAYLVLFPFYVWSSGLPQPADAVFGILFLLIVRTPGISPASNRLFVIVVAFTVWTTAVGISWALLLADNETKSRFGPLMFPLFYIFNAAVVYVCLWLADRVPAAFLRVTTAGCLASILVQFAVSLAGSSGRGRVQNFFNNPNQLGYYALLCAAIIALTVPKKETFIGVIGVVAGVLVSVASLSKAALVGCVALLALQVIRSSRAALGIALVSGALMSTSWFGEQQERVGWRFADKGSDDTLEQRGYDRIAAFPEYLVLGAGEGAMDRFALGFKGEMHSSFGTVLFSYGIVGFAIFALILWRSASSGGVRASLYLLPVLLYGLTHQGLRSRLFWILVALIYIVGVQRARAAWAARRAKRGPRGVVRTPAPSTNASNAAKVNA